MKRIPFNKNWETKHVIKMVLMPDSILIKRVKKSQASVVVIKERSGRTKATSKDS